MGNIFVFIYNFFTRRKLVFYAIISGIVAVIVFSVFHLRLQENINSIMPVDSRIDAINNVLKNSRLSDRLVLDFSLKDTMASNPDLLKEKAKELVSLLRKDSALIKKINFRIDNASFRSIYDFFYNHLPLYLDDKDYDKIDSILSNKEEIKKTLTADFKSLISPAGIITKKYIFRDPFNITPLALKQLQNFRLDKNFIIYNSCIYTKDKKDLLIFIDPKYPSGNIDKNKPLIAQLDSAIKDVLQNSPEININYYGGTAVAIANAVRIKKDIMLTVNIAFIFILFFFIFFFRRGKILILIFIPTLLGAGIAISIISFVYGSISNIALGIGAVLVGISVDYSLHLFTHLRKNGSITETLKDISAPLIMSTTTTAVAFLSLFIVRSKALNQLGLFGALSVLFAAIVVLTIIPVFLSEKKLRKADKRGLSFLENIAGYEWHKNKYIIVAIILLSIIFSFTIKDVRFDSDIAHMNYQPEKLTRAEKKLEKISSETLSSVYLIASGKSLEEALDVMNSKEDILSKAESEGLISRASVPTDLILTKERQQKKIEQWNCFWDKVDRKKLEATIKQEGIYFKGDAFDQFYHLINKDYKPVPVEDFSALRKDFLNNYVSSHGGNYSVAAILKVDKKNKSRLFAKFKGDNNIVIFDKQYFSNQFFNVLKEDFDKLMFLSMFLVFAILLISFGRIELSLITFFPIILSWLWTLGLMGLFGIKFNIFNIIISTFIFGLGVDYSIFIMRGLLNNYKYGEKSVTPYKLSVLLSVITTILGIGVLIFAKHPALKSIAIVTIFGIFSVVIISYTILPLLFSILTMHKGRRRKEPLTMLNTLISVFSLLLLIIMAFVLTSLIPVIYILPLPRKNIKHLFNILISFGSKFIVWINFTIKKERIDFEKADFSKPSIIVSNHQSHLDLVLLLRLYPKLIVVTNKWVWNNPIYGLIIRFADYYPIFKGMDFDMEKLKRKVSEGYSIVVFPEGSRTPDGTIKRFHQGAFKLADDLGLEITPVLIHGAYQCLPKTEFFMRSGKITQKFFDRIKVKPVNIDKNETYREQAKQLTRYMRNEFRKLSLQIENTDFYKRSLVNQYIYKGPMLEWYVKTKLRLESNYRFLNEIIPLKAAIVDVGCGYGYLSHLLRFVSKERTITGLDYDPEKIDVANHIGLYDDGINFYVKDVSTAEIPKADVYILNDVLHDMPQKLQLKVLSKCFDKVSPNGTVIVKDAGMPRRTPMTIIAKIFMPDKTVYKSARISGKTICDMAASKGFGCKRMYLSGHISNITYIFRNGKQI